MTHNTANSSAAIFTAEQSPYVKYLSATKREEARTLERDLRAAAAVVKQRNTADSSRTAYTCTIAELQDIELHTGGKDYNLHTSATLVDGGLAVPKPGSVTNFLDRLGDCGPSVHTRIIVFHGDRATAEGEAADGLLFCHILGTVLDLPPVDVRFLAQLNEPASQTLKQPPRLYQLPMKPGFVSLGESTNCWNRGAAAYLGRRRLGKHAPHVGEFIPGS